MRNQPRITTIALVTSINTALFAYAAYVTEAAGTRMMLVGGSVLMGVVTTALLGIWFAQNRQRIKSGDVFA